MNFESFLQVQTHLFGVRRAIPCMPGVEPTEVAGDRSWRATMPRRVGGRA